MTIRRRVTARAVAGGAALSLTAMLVPVMGATPAGASSAPEVVATGLHGPTKLTFDSSGNLYVAEAGTFDPPDDPSTSCVGSGDEGTCIGDTGAIAQVDIGTGAVERVVTGLPSLAGGATDVVVHDDGSMDVSIGCGCGPDDRDALPAFSVLGTIQHIDPEGNRSTLADIAQFEFDNNPDSDQPDSELDSNPFDLEAYPGGLLVADAGGNDVLSVDGEGTVSLVAKFPFRDVPAPPFLGAPPGTMIPMQPVPTAASLGANGLLVSGLPGFPFPPGGALIYDVAEDGSSTNFATGLSGLTDIAQAEDGTVYALQFATDLLAAESGGQSASELVQIRPDGTRKVILRDGLVTPGGIAIGPDGMIYVTNDQFNPEGGSVLRVDPDVARDPATALACDPTVVPGTPFYEEIAPSVHREAIECVAFWGLLNGRSESQFAPSMSLTRGQTALVIQRLLERAGIEVTGDEPDAFADDDGSIYEDAIDLVASLDIVRGLPDGTFRPKALVTRGQLASILNATWTAVTEETLEGTDAFGDDDGSVHEDAINAVADAGWMIGRSEGVFEPNSPVTRGQASSALARMLSSFLDAGDFLDVPWTD